MLFQHFHPHQLWLMTPGPLCLKWWLRASVQEVCKVRTTFKINLSIHETNAWDLQCIGLVHINCHSRCETLLELQLSIEKWDKNLPLFLNKETNGIFFLLLIITYKIKLCYSRSILNFLIEKEYWEVLIISAMIKLILMKGMCLKPYFEDIA